MNRTSENITPPPLALLAELTHRCPLACPYCSNPVELTKAGKELSTEEWIDVFRQASELGVLHLHLSGGEPASRRDLEELVAAAVRTDLYTNLITSGIGISRQRLFKMVENGLDHIQLSLQGNDAESADLVGGYRGGHERKLRLAEWIGETGIPLTVNAVCHRGNIQTVPELINLARIIGARRIEIATVQFYGWALLNREQLMPTREQVDTTSEIIEQLREDFEGSLVIDYVPADYYATYPKACMGGWGRTGINIDPSGKVLPCHAAETIPELEFENVRNKSLENIWFHSASFNAFRGTDWMQEPCLSCERKLVDFGGCRCQALAIASDAKATDPVCSKSALKSHILEITSTKAADGYIYRGR